MTIHKRTRDFEAAGAVPNSFDGWLARVTSRSALVWAEHCTECVWPTCYADCPLYAPRDDLLCRRFVDGIQITDAIDGVETRGRYRKLEFRRLGKLEAASRVRLQMMHTADFSQKIIDGLDTAHRRFPLAVRRRTQHTVGRLIGNVAGHGNHLDRNDVFLILADYEGKIPIACTLTVRARDPASTGLFQAGVRLTPGKSEHVIRVSEMCRLIDLDADVLVQFEPAGDAPPGAITFAFLDFARLRSSSPEPATPTNSEDTSSGPTAKCVVWDLDNTIWQGVLVEDGLDKLRLEPKAVATIIELDRRGILQSVASKNTDDAAREALRHFGLDQYLLYPQINWGPKSASLSAIADALNIGLDTFVFVDDQPFERAEVSVAHPGVTVIDAAELDDLLSRPMFAVPVTAESRRRRSMYQEEQTRDVAQLGSADTFFDFLRSCGLHLSVRAIEGATVARVKELAQRTNQLNYAGRRLSDADLAALLQPGASRVGLILSVRDRFGDYGAIGFAVVDRATFSVDNFFMSCRVQRKTVEHAFFAGLQAHAHAGGVETIRIAYQSTARNTPAWQALQDMRIVNERDMRPQASAELQLRADHAIPHADIVTTDFPWPADTAMSSRHADAAE